MRQRLWSHLKIMNTYIKDRRKWQRVAKLLKGFQAMRRQNWSHLKIVNTSIKDLKSSLKVVNQVPKESHQTLRQHLSFHQIMNSYIKDRQRWRRVAKVLKGLQEMRRKLWLRRQIMNTYEGFVSKGLKRHNFALDCVLSTAVTKPKSAILTTTSLFSSNLISILSGHKSLWIICRFCGYLAHFYLKKFAPIC
jgi:hypothetical protein